ncbi:MAG: tetratricopeptide repeat protein [Chlorobiaceae bacterium]|nr:tetratricopeptide repeat protein [Chlorobiaceae bacterium]
MKRLAITLVLAVMALLLPVLRCPAQTANDSFTEALSKHHSGDLREAIRLYSKSIDHDSLHVMAYLMRGAAWHKLRQFENAIADYTKVIDLGDPLFQAVGYFNRGVVRNLSGQYQEAIPDFSLAISLDKKMSAAFFHRGIARVRIGDQTGTFDDLNEAARLGDPDAECWLDTTTPGWRVMNR